MGLFVLIFYVCRTDGKEAFFRSKASNQLSLNISSELSLKDFSFSELITAVKVLMDTEGVPGLVKAMVILVEMLLIKSGVRCPHCENEKYHLHSKGEGTLKTTIGEVRIVLSRLKCQGCGKTYCPLNKLMGYLGVRDGTYDASPLVPEY